MKAIKRTLLLFVGLLGLSLLASPRLAHAGPIIVGNGGGSSEFYLFYVKNQAAEWLSLCRDLGDCSDGIAPNLDLFLAAKPWTSPIVLESEKTMGTSVFKTEPFAGSVITVNQGLLWKNTGSKEEALDFSEVLALLLRAWTFQLGVNTGSTDLLVHNLTALLSEDFVRSVWLHPPAHNLAVVQFRSMPDLVFIEDRSKSDFARSQELSLSRLFSCQQSSGVDEAPVLSSTSQFRWNQIIGPQGKQMISLTSTLKYSCRDVSGSVAEYSARLMLQLPVFENQDEPVISFHIKEGQLRLLLSGIEKLQ